MGGAGGTAVHEARPREFRHQRPRRRIADDRGGLSENSRTDESHPHPAQRPWRRRGTSSRRARGTHRAHDDG